MKYMILKKVSGNKVIPLEWEHIGAEIRSRLIEKLLMEKQ